MSDLRRDYRQQPLREEDMSRDPIEQFAIWFDAAVDHGIEIPNAMVLATSTPDGVPSARYVLMKDFDAGGFVFYSHSVSAKGVQLGLNPRAALVFYWQPLHRQVRVEGSVTPVASEEADDYFESRPYGSRVSVWVAPQSSAVKSREAMEARFQQISTQYPDTVPRPETWVGYRVRPERIEFWQGREDRMHDRLLYTREGASAWHMQRLAP